MKITAFGAAEGVTGTKHLLEVNGSRILLDCGMFQGLRKESDLKNRRLPFDAKTIDSVVLSHAHIDHSGILPVLAKDGTQKKDSAGNEVFAYDESEGEYYNRVIDQLVSDKKFPHAEAAKESLITALDRLDENTEGGLKAVMDAVNTLASQVAPRRRLATQAERDNKGDPAGG